jgi:exopolysaccharide production protein ExoQ
MNLIAGARHRPETGESFVDDRLTLADFGAIAVLVCYLTLKFGPFEQLWFPPGGVSTFIVPAMAITVLVITPTAALARAPISLPFLAIIAWSAMSVVWSLDATFTMFLIRSEVPALLLTLLVVASMRLDLLTTTLVRFVQTFVVWSLLTSLTRSASQASLTSDTISGVLIGWRGTFDHKNGLGMFLVFGLATVLAFERHRLLRPISIALCVIGVIGTRSATAASGLMVLGLMWVWLSAVSVSRNRRDQAIFAILSVMIAALAVLLALGMLPSFLVLYGKDLTFSGRTIIWANTIDAIGQRPAFGIGFISNWSSVQVPLILDMRRSIGFEAAHGHNGVLEVVFELGIVGLALYAIFFFSVVRLGMRALKTANPFGRWALASCVALLIMSVSEVLFQGIFLTYLAIIWTAVTRADRAARRSSVIRRR